MSWVAVVMGAAALAGLVVGDSPSRSYHVGRPRRPLQLLMLAQASFFGATLMGEKGSPACWAAISLRISKWYKNP
jgi:hypothetical protein